MVAASRIILLGQNLFFQGRIETVAEPLGYSVRQAHTEADFWDNYAEGETELVLVDLEGDADTWSSVLTGLGQRTSARRIPRVLRIVAFRSPRGYGHRWSGRRHWARSRR